MKINKNSWSYKIYCWFLGCEPASANLCPYFRTVFLWAPLRFLFYNGKIPLKGRWYIPVNFVLYGSLLVEVPRWLGIVSFKAKTIAYTIELFVAMVAVAVGIMVFTILQFEKYKERRLRNSMTPLELQHYEDFRHIPERLRKRGLDRRIADWFGGVLDKASDSLVLEYIRALHNKVCPLISFEDNK